MAADRKWWGTVRFRVTLLATVAVAVVLAITSVVLVVRQRASLLEQLDESLQRDATALAGDFSAGENGEIGPLGEDDYVARVVADDGTVLASSPGFADGDGSRVVSRRFVNPDGSGGTVFVASPLEDVDDAVGALIRSLALIVPLAIVALAGVVWVVVGRTLRPVEEIRSQVAGIGLRQLDQRVPQPPGDDEIARLAATMNGMLDRLDRASRRQQQFVADASHELRTPLTRMRSELEVGTATPASLLEEIEAQQRMIEDLLLLARADAGALAVARDPVDLDDVVMEEARARRTSGVTIDTSAVSGAQVRGHADQLRRIVGNLLDNAVRHATRTVRVELTERDGHAVLIVSDDGPGVPSERRDEIFERFTRLDDARSGGPGRAGLGLAIARDLVVRHAGTITVDGDGTSGARFVVNLPASS